MQFWINYIQAVILFAVTDILITFIFHLAIEIKIVDYREILHKISSLFYIINLSHGKNTSVIKRVDLFHFMNL